MKVHTYTSKGEKLADSTLPASMTSDINMYILAQAVRVYEDRVHPMRGIVKTRAEVTASTRKIYKQKGTGRARHGSISAPIFVGGGKAHGPRGLKRVLTLPVVIRRKALKVAFSLKAKENKLVFVTGLDLLDKTKKSQTLIDKVSSGEAYKSGSKITFLLSKENKEVQKYVRNIENVNVSSFDQANAYTVYRGGVIFVDADMFEKQEKVVKKSTKKVAPKKTIVKETK